MRRPCTATERARRLLLARAPWWMRLVEVGVLLAGLYASRQLTIQYWKLPTGDVAEYYHYALAFWTLRPPFHLFPVEYPPLAIVPFSFTLLPPLPDYPLMYAVWMSAIFIAGFYAMARFASRRRAWVYVVYLLIGAPALLLERFDLVPALLTLVALWATQRRRFGYAYLLLAAGILLKLYPVFLVPVVVIEHWRVARARFGTAASDAALRSAWESLRQWHAGKAVRRLASDPAVRQVARGALLCAGAVGIGFLGPLALNPMGALSGFAYAGDRPLQIESTPASLLWLGTLVGIPAHPVFSFASLNYVGPLDVALKPLSALALAAGCVVVYWRQAQGKLSVGQACVACLCAVIVTNKIFSPQYLIWVVPLVASVDGFDVLWLLVCMLTTVDYPIIYQMRPLIEVPYTPAFMPVVAARNLVLVYITARAIFRQPARVRRALPSPDAQRPAADSAPPADVAVDTAPALVH